MCEGARLSFRPALRAVNAATYMLKRFLRSFCVEQPEFLALPLCDTKQLQKNSPFLGKGSIKRSNRSRGLLLVASVNVLFSLEFWLFFAQLRCKLNFFMWKTQDAMKKHPEQISHGSPTDPGQRSVLSHTHTPGDAGQPGPSGAFAATGK